MKEKKSKANEYLIDIHFGNKRRHTFKGKLEKCVIIQGKDSINIHLIKMEKEETPLLIDSYSAITDTPVRLTPKALTKAHLRGKV